MAFRGRSFRGRRGAEPRHSTAGGRTYTVEDALRSSSRHGLTWSHDIRSPWEIARLMGTLLALVEGEHVGVEGSLRAPEAMLAGFAGLTRTSAFTRDILSFQKDLNIIAIVVMAVSGSEEEFELFATLMLRAARDRLIDHYGRDVLVQVAEAALQEASDARINTSPVAVVPVTNNLTQQPPPQLPTLPGRGVKQLPAGSPAGRSLDDLFKIVEGILPLIGQAPGQQNGVNQASQSGPPSNTIAGNALATAVGLEGGGAAAPAAEATGNAAQTGIAGLVNG